MNETSILAGGRPLVVTILDAAQLTRLSPATIRRLVVAEHIPSIRVGRRRLIPMAAIERLIAGGAPTTTRRSQDSGGYDR